MGSEVDSLKRKMVQVWSGLAKVSMLVRVVHGSQVEYSPEMDPAATSM